MLLEVHQVEFPTARSNESIRSALLQEYMTRKRWEREKGLNLRYRKIHIHVGTHRLALYLYK